MELSRRDIMRIGTGAAFAGCLPQLGQTATMDEAMHAFTGGADVIDGGIELIAPEIAENGNTVPISVSAPDAVMVAVFAEANPEAEVVQFKFGPLAGSRDASTRIRLARTQNVIAVAQMSDGSLRRAVQEVKVTIGGCGG